METSRKPSCIMKAEQQEHGSIAGEGITSMRCACIQKGMSTRNEELQETVRQSVIGVEYSWITCCDAIMEPEVMSTHLWFHAPRAAIVATEDEAGTCRANVAGGFATNKL